MADAGGSTKQLKQTLGFFDLLSASVGQIIGAGVMTLLGTAMATSGRALPFAFLVAFLITVSNAIPQIFIASTVRLRGGPYTIVAMLAGQKFAGLYTISYIFSNLSLAMYALSFASYFCSLFNIDSSMEQWVAAAVLTLFYILNLMGIDAFAKVQNALVVVLIFSLLIFVIMGIGRVNWGGYFVRDAGWMPQGLMGVFQAGALLTFAIGGGTAAVNYSAEAKNPTRDIPMAVIISTLSVAVLYAFISFVAAGVLPVEQVMNQNLTLVAGEILNRPLYIVFIVGGAGCALLTTLNNSLASKTKPVMQMCDDGWLPAKLATLNKHKCPMYILTIMYVIGMVCIVTGLSISILGNMTLISSAVTGLIQAVGLARLPKVVPEEWAKSRFHVASSVLVVFAVLASVACLFQAYMNARGLSPVLLGINVVVIVGGFIFGTVQSKSVHMEISYEAVS